MGCMTGVHVPTLLLGFIVGTVVMFGWQYTRPNTPAHPPPPIHSNPPPTPVVVDADEPSEVDGPDSPATQLPATEAPAKPATPLSLPAPATPESPAKPVPTAPPANTPPPPAAPTPAPAAPAPAAPATPPPARAPSTLPPLPSTSRCIRDAIAVVEARSRLRVLDPHKERFGPPPGKPVPKEDENKKLVSEFDDDPFHGNGNVVMTPWDCHRLHRCCQPRLESHDYDPEFGAGTTLDHVMFIVSCSDARKDNCRKSVRDGWAHHSEVNDRLFMFSDKTDPELGSHRPPGMDGFGHGVEHALLGLGSQWLVENHREVLKHTRWFVFVDDDTWINTPRLLEELNKLEYRLPLIMGHVWRTGVHPSKPYNHLSGEASYVMSHEAFSRIIPRLSKPPATPAPSPVPAAAAATDSCPWLGTESLDVVVSLCARRTNVLLIHSELFQWTVGRNLWAMPPFNGQRLFLGALSAVSGHNLEMTEMRAMSDFTERYHKTFLSDYSPVGVRHWYHKPKA